MADLLEQGRKMRYDRLVVHDQRKCHALRINQPDEPSNSRARGKRMSAQSLRWRLAGIVIWAAWALTGTLLSPPAQPARAKEPELEALANEYVKGIRPLAQRYCHRCHGAKRTEADINLEEIATW